MLVEILFAGGLISAGILILVSMGGLIKSVSGLLRGKKEKFTILAESRS